MIKLVDLNLCDTPSILRTFKIVYIILIFLIEIDIAH